MTARELLDIQLDSTLQTLHRVWDGLTDADIDFRAHSSMLTIREALAHLAECNVCLAALLAGADYNWGAFQPSGQTLDELRQEFLDLRSEAVDEIHRQDSERAYRLGVDFLGQHEWYHIGQMAATRHALNPNWSSSLLYAH